MIPQPLAITSPEAKRARFAVSLMFLTNGALFANMVPRYPGIKADLDLTNTAYGLAIATFPAGAIIAGVGAGIVIRRIGSAPAAALCTILTAVGVAGAGFSNTLIPLLLALFLAGAMDAVTDVAQNAHGLRVQRHYGRSVINSFHAIWSVGAVIGGLLAAGAITLGLSRATHLGITAVMFSIIAVFAYALRLPGRDEDDPLRPVKHEVTGPRRRLGFATRTAVLLTGLVIVAGAGGLVEDAGASWAALYLTEGLGAIPAAGAFGLVALVGAQFVARLLGDRQVDRYGPRAVARLGGVITGAGMGIALAFPSVPMTILGFAAAGYGIATLVPSAMNQADEIPGLKSGTGVTIVSWLMRLGFLFSPPLVGIVADNYGLRIGLLIVPLAGLAIFSFAGVLSKTKFTSTSTAGPELLTN